jgi:23S rRNA (adenine2503-C2)-methyltransferase
MQKQNLIGLTRGQLEAFVESFGEQKYRGTQLYSWTYGKGAQTFDEMTNISKESRELLNRVAAFEHLQLVSSGTSTDGTTKFLFGLTDHLAIESVLIPPDKKSPNAETRLTLCLSTQVGCPLECKFCATGTMGFARNLTAGEIIDQVLQVQRLSHHRITNLVYMGMGEPMLNYENVMKSIDIITDDNALNIGTRHITISTAGYADGIRRMADENRKVKLALSLHSLDNEKRGMLMPITKKYSVSDLIDALEYYYRKTRHRPTFEYILFDGFNDTGSDIKKFEHLAKRIPCKVNIIPYHSIDFTHPSGFAASLKPTPRAHMEAFAARLRQVNITVMIRSSSGQDINAACGQLAIEGKNRNKSAGTAKSESAPDQIAVPYQ